jgi:hypothetical protein
VLLLSAAVIAAAALLVLATIVATSVAFMPTQTARNPPTQT